MHTERNSDECSKAIVGHISLTKLRNEVLKMHVMLIIISSVCLIRSNYNDKHCIIHVALAFLQYIIYICLINSSTELTLVSQPIIILAKSVWDSLKNYLYIIMSFKKRSNNLSDIVSSSIPHFWCFPSHLLITLNVF